MSDLSDTVTVTDVDADQAWAFERGDIALAEYEARIDAIIASIAEIAATGGDGVVFAHTKMCEIDDEGGGCTCEPEVLPVAKPPTLPM